MDGRDLSRRRASLRRLPRALRGQVPEGDSLPRARTRIRARTICTPPWTGCSSARTPSSGAWPSGTSRTAPRCSTTSRRCGSKGAIARWPSADTRATARRAKLQIEFRLLCGDTAGCPVAVEVFDGNTADPATVSAQVDRLEAPLRVLQGDAGGRSGDADRGAHPRGREAGGLDWISALGGPAARSLVESGGTDIAVRRDRPGRGCAATPVRASTSSASWCAAIRRWRYHLRRTWANPTGRR